jgi:hypothetical protein
MASHDLRAGSAKHSCLCSIITWTSSTTAFPASCSLLPYCSTSIGHTHLLTQPFFHFLSPLKDHLPPSRFWYHFQIVSQPYIAVLTLFPSPSPPQAGCRRYNRYNLSKAALSSTVRSFPTCLVETRTCLSRMTNLPISGPLSIPVSTVSNWRREVPQRKTMPFLMTQFQKVPKNSILTTCLLFLDLSFCFEGDSSTCLGRALLLAQRVLLLQGDSPARLGCALLLGAAALCETTIQEFEQKLICLSPCFLTPPNGTSPLRLAATG